MVRCHRVLVMVVVLGLAAACGGGSSPSQENRRYVAIGDSYVSGPGLIDQDPETPACLRSERNYPHLVAARLKRTDLVDVSCGGATTASVQNGSTTAQGDPIKPQLDALTPDTKLVTVGIGANDAQLVLWLFARCLIGTSATNANCTNFTEKYAPTVYAATRDRVATTLSKVRKLAPNALVLLVGYLRIVPDSGSCPALKISETNRAEALKVELALTNSLRDAARKAGVRFVDVRAISRGHDACAGKDAWVNGTADVPGDGVLLHPNEAGMHAVAERVLKAVGRF